jgi:hypothetical protein
MGRGTKKKPARDARSQSVAGSQKNYQEMMEITQTFQGIFVHTLAPCQRSLLPAGSQNLAILVS